MAEIHMRQIKAQLQANYGGKIDLTDLGGMLNDTIDPVFLTRGLAAFALKSLNDISYDESSACITDGYQDNGIDAVYYNEAEKILYLVQAKYSQDGTGTINLGDAQKFLQGFKDIINARYERFNGKLQIKQPVIDAALDDTNTKIMLVIVYTGQAPLSTEANNAIKDVLQENNDPTEVVIVKILRQQNIYAFIAQGAAGSSINLDVALEQWGVVREPYLSYYGMVNASDIVDWWNQYYPKIFEPNIRVYLGDTSVNDSIGDTLRTEPQNFWYYNNGITALCDNVKKRPIGGASRESGVFVCEGFQIVNGAQTVGSVATANTVMPEQVAQAKVFIKIKSLENCPEEFKAYVTRNTNTQNRIEKRDFVSLDPEQERIKNELGLENIHYVYKTGSSIPTSTNGFDLNEATLARACSEPDVALTVQAKREIGKLWEDITKAPYRALFHAGVNGLALWKKVCVLRSVETSLEQLRAGKSGRNKLLLVHGNRIVAHIVFKRLPHNIGGTLDALSAQDIAVINNLTTAASEEVITQANAYYPDSYPANIFKNLTKCKILIGTII